MRIIQTLFLCLMLLTVAACATPKQPPMPVGNLKLGIANFTHPKDSSDMMAGYMSEDTPPIKLEVLASLDKIFSNVLHKHSKNSFIFMDQDLYLARYAKKDATGPKAALNRWSAIGRSLKVDILVVPQAIEWSERNGSSFGVTKPAKVVMDFFVINVKDNTLISRSHIDETQSALSANLLEAGKFFKRGGKWISAFELSQEEMERAVKELGL